MIRGELWHRKGHPAETYTAIIPIPDVDNDEWIETAEVVYVRQHGALQEAKVHSMPLVLWVLGMDPVRPLNRTERRTQRFAQRRRGR